MNIANPNLLINLTSLLKVLSVHNNCVIAGGAIRDCIFGKNVNDIDVFYWEEFDFSGLPIYVGPTITINDSSYNNHVCTHKGYITLNGASFFIDYIRISPACLSLKQVLESFPINVSQVALDSMGNLYHTDAFLKCVEDKTLIFSPDCPMDYKQKIQAKYDDWNQQNPIKSDKDLLAELMFDPSEIAAIKKKMVKLKIKPVNDDLPKVKYRIINTTQEKPLYRTLP